MATVLDDVFTLADMLRAAASLTDAMGRLVSAAQAREARCASPCHLRTLEEVGVVRGERDGRRHVYAIDTAAPLGGLEGLLGQVRTLAATCCPPRRSSR